MEKGSGSSVIHLVLHTLRVQQLTATGPGRYRCGFLIPTAKGADALAAFVANCFKAALLPVNLFAVCLE
jgi:histone H3